MFLLESLPAILLAPVVLVVMTDRPSMATWLTTEERAWMNERLEREQQAVEQAHTRLTLSQALTNPRLLVLSTMYFTIVTATYGITFFLPLIVKSHGLSNMATGLVTAIPYVLGVIGMVIWAYSSDRRHERRWHIAAASALAAAGFVGAGASPDLYWAIASVSVAAVGVYAYKPCFWPLPSTFLSGTAAAGGIALINAIGNLGGFVGPYVVGWIRDSTNSYSAGLYFLAACAAASGVIAVISVKPGPVVAQRGAI
jgi:ACS family tartrate transporter-like MFS transporter